MKVLLSIKPRFAEKIFSGEKLFEFRRAIFTKIVNKVIVYASAPTQKVIGEFEIEYIMHYNLVELWAETKEFAGISFEVFEKYFKSKNMGYAIKIKNPELYDKPLDIMKNFGVVPPQSFIYIR